ncbi:COG3650 family protein [Parasphingorhabdus sp.]|uniref:COG3650 family protein n=1 Tax=Parasphingorhabdus sp. TaxID=2709688 RepID=UPI003C78A3A1
MKYRILLSSLAALSLSGCGEPAEEPVEEAKLGDYSAIGTEPGWGVEIKDETIAFTTQDGNDFSLPVYRMDKTGSGWEVKGFSDADNINIYITSGETCSDGMSDRSYADTVKVEASKSGSLSGCGGAITEGPNGPP